MQVFYARWQWLEAFFYIPVFGSKCVPVQHMVNILCAVLLGPFYGVGVAFCASLSPKSSGYRQFDGVPRQYVWGVALRACLLETKSIPLTLIAEVFGHSRFWAVCVHYPVAILFMGMQAGRLRFMPMSFRF